jgi:hypothetical protein
MAVKSIGGYDWANRLYISALLYDALVINAHGTMLRFPAQKKAQFVTVKDSMNFLRFMF